MSKAELHYLTCQDENCDKFACVARRDYEHRINDHSEMELAVVRHHRDELLQEVKELRRLLNEK